MKILVYGSLNIDCTYTLDHIVKEGETQASFGFSMAAGGKGANQCAAIAKALGGKFANVFFAGKAGADGAFILQKLQSYGVYTNHVHESETGTGQAIIQLDRNGQNSIILFGGGNQENTKEEMDQVLSCFVAGDILVMNAEINNLDYLFSKALEKGLEIWVNPSPITDSLLALPLEKSQMLVLNEVEGAALSGQSESSDYLTILGALCDKYPKSGIVLTAGEHGAYFGYSQGYMQVPACETTVVDTTGAGDTFLGYMLAGRVMGLDMKACLERACRASAIAVSRKGAMDAIPFASEVD